MVKIFAFLDLGKTISFADSLLGLGLCALQLPLDIDIHLIV